MKNLIKIVQLFQIRVFFLILLCLNFSCESKTAKVLEWIGDHKGEKFNEDHLSELKSKFGEPEIILGGYDDYVESESYMRIFFLGPYFESEEGKKLFAEAGTYEKKYPNGKKYEEIYLRRVNEKSNGSRFSMHELYRSIKNKFPDYSHNKISWMIQSEIGGYLWRHYEGIVSNVNDIHYKFNTGEENWIGYGVDPDLNKQNLKDFKVNTFYSVVVTSDGSISGNYGEGESCITENSKLDFENYVIGNWESFGSARFMFRSDGTYSFNSRLNKVTGEWWIACDGKLITSYNPDIKITDSGLLLGETLYTKS